VPFDLSTADLIGSVGVALLLAAFALNLSGHLHRDGAAYAMLNAIGAGLAAYASWLIPYWPFVILEGTWCAVSLWALGAALLRRKNSAL